MQGIASLALRLLWVPAHGTCIHMGRWCRTDITWTVLYVLLRILVQRLSVMCRRPHWRMTWALRQKVREDVQIITRSERDDVVLATDEYRLHASVDALVVITKAAKMRASHKAKRGWMARR